MATASKTKTEETICSVTVNKAHDPWLYKIKDIESMSVKILVKDPVEGTTFTLEINKEKLESLVRETIKNYYEKWRDVLRDNLHSA